MIKQAKEKRAALKKKKTIVCCNSTLNPYLFLLGISPQITKFN